MKSICFLFSIFSIALLSCAEEISPVTRCKEESIIGDWLWQKTEGGVGGIQLTPDNTGWNIRLEIGDSIWREFRNDTLIFESPYIFNRDSNSLDYYGYVDFEHTLGLFLRKVNCVLELNYGFDDNPTGYYESEK